jgi:hypothetical protein
MNAQGAPTSFIELSLGAAANPVASRGRLDVRGWLEGATASVDVLHETYNALLAFVVPGRDEYSIQQAVTTALIATIDGVAAYPHNFAAILAAILNNIALGVNGTATGPFTSPFARLSAQEKAWAFQFMGSDDVLKVIADVLPGFVAFFTYSEAGGFDPASRSLTSVPPTAAYFTTTVTSCGNNPPSWASARIT